MGLDPLYDVGMVTATTPFFLMTVFSKHSARNLQEKTLRVLSGVVLEEKWKLTGVRMAVHQCVAGTSTPLVHWLSPLRVPQVLLNAFQVLTCLSDLPPNVSPFS
jgi:hypothetical protein